MATVLAVIPAYDEAERIAPVVRAALRHAPTLVVDDGSTDATADVAAAAGAEVLRQSPNQGKGAALRAGFRHALAQDAHAVITLDADGQHDPDEIPRFLEAFARGGGDLIVGRRSFDQMPPVRRLANSLGQALFSWAMGQPIPDNQSGYRLLSRRMVERLLDHSEAGFEFEVEMFATCVRNRFGLGWVPIRTIYAGETSHIHPWQHTVNFIRMVWTIRQRMRASAGG